MRQCKHTKTLCEGAAESSKGMEQEWPHPFIPMLADLLVRLILSDCLLLVFVFGNHSQYSQLNWNTFCTVHSLTFYSRTEMEPRSRPGCRGQRSSDSLSLVVSLTSCLGASHTPFPFALLHPPHLHSPHQLLLTPSLMSSETTLLCQLAAVAGDVISG